MGVDDGMEAVRRDQLRHQLGRDPGRDGEDDGLARRDRVDAIAEVPARVDCRIVELDRAQPPAEADRRVLFGQPRDRRLDERGREAGLGDHRPAGLAAARQCARQDRGGERGIGARRPAC